MSKRQAFGPAALACAVMLLLGCGGGAGGGSEPTIAARLELVPQGPDEPVPSGSVQSRVLELRNTGNGVARGVIIRVEPDVRVLQLPLLCEGALASACRVTDDGALELSALPAGAALTLRQRLRLDAAFSGAVRNDWRLSSTGAATTNWMQSLQGHTADLSVAVAAPTVSVSGANEMLSYELVLSNAGPDAAHDIAWQQSSSPGMSWQGATCSAEGGAACPAQLAELIRIDRLPQGGSLRLTTRYAAREASLAGRHYLNSEASALGDANPRNDRAEHRQAKVSDEEGHYRIFSLDGSRFLLAYSRYGGRSVRVTNESVDWRGDAIEDVTRYIALGDAEARDEPPLKRGSLLHGPVNGVVAGALNLGEERRPFLGARSFVREWSELEGLQFNLFGSKADRDGHPVGAFVWTGRFSNGALEACASKRPTAIESCARADLRRWSVAIVGQELELTDATGSVSRLSAARTPSGPVLLMSRLASADGLREFWLGLPVLPSLTYEGAPGYEYFSAETTFGSDQGAAFPGFGEFNFWDYPNSVKLDANGLPNVLFVYNSVYGPICLLNATRFERTGVPSLLAGEMSASRGQEPCWRGPVYYAQTRELRVALGASEGALAGRWMISVRY